MTVNSRGSGSDERSAENDSKTGAASPADDTTGDVPGGKRGSRPAGEASAAKTLRVGARVLVTRGYSKGERGEVTNSPGRVFNGWTVKLDNGRIFGAGEWELRAES